MGTHRINANKTFHGIDWIVIYPVDSAIYLLNDWGPTIYTVYSRVKFKDES